VTPRPVTNIGASVRQRLLNLARERAPSLFDQLLQYYAIERFLARLARTPWADVLAARRRGAVVVTAVVPVAPTLRLASGTLAIQTSLGTMNNVRSYSTPLPPASPRHAGQRPPRRRFVSPAAPPPRSYACGHDAVTPFAPVPTIGSASSCGPQRHP
jgi:hypothetical protein